MTTREFIVIGVDYAGDSTGSITINGTEVHSGEFMHGQVPQYDRAFLADGVYTFDDTANETTVPVTVTVTEGNLHFGLISWNYGMLDNERYTPEYRTIVTNPASTKSQRLAVYFSVANPAFSSEETAFLEGNDPAQRSDRMRLLAQHQCFPLIQQPDVFNYGVTEATIYCNRTNELINGEPAPNAGTNRPELLTTGDIYTFDMVIFSSVYVPTLSSM